MALIRAGANLAALGVVLLAVLWLLLWLLVGDRFWWSLVIHTLVPWFFVIGLGPGALCALVGGSRPVQGAILATTLLALWLWGGLFLPNWPAGSGGTPIRVVSLNTLTSNTATDAIIESIRATDADVVALQELSPSQAEAVTAALGERYPYQALLPWTDPRGIGLWSRFPVEPITTFSDDPWENWLQHVVLSVNGRRVHFLNAHLWPPSRSPNTFPDMQARRLAQANQLATYLARLPPSEPFLVAGDFNLTSLNEGYAEMSRVAGDSWASVGWGFGFTWPDRIFHPLMPPVFRIDYLWYGPGVRPTRATVLPAGTGSDHRGVVGDFRLPIPP